MSKVRQRAYRFARALASDIRATVLEDKDKAALPADSNWQPFPSAPRHTLVGPQLKGTAMSEKREQFVRDVDLQEGWRKPVKPPKASARPGGLPPAAPKQQAPVNPPKEKRNG
jgi:hypothetical protein